MAAGSSQVEHLREIAVACRDEGIRHATFHSDGRVATIEMAVVDNPVARARTVQQAAQAASNPPSPKDKKRPPARGYDEDDVYDPGDLADPANFPGGAVPFFKKKGNG